MAGVVEYILRARDMLSPVFAQASKGAQAVSKQIDKITTTQKQSFKSIEVLDAKLVVLGDKKRMAFNEKDVVRFNTEIRKVKSQLDRLNNLPPQTFIQRMQEANGSASGLLGQFKGIIATVGAFQGVKSILSLATSLEQSQIGFEVLLGSAEKAKTMLGNINDYSKNAVYDKAGLIESAKLMLAYGTSAEKILPNLKMIGDIAIGDAQKMNTLAYNYAQMTSLGKLNAIDRKSMALAGFDPLSELAKMGAHSLPQLEKMMAQGQISVAMVESAFKHATSEGGQFFGMMSKMSETTSGKFNKLTGNLKDVGAEIGLKLLPYANKLIDFLMPMVDWIGRNADMVLQLTAVAMGAVLAFKIVVGVIKLWTIAQALLNGTMFLNPIGLVIAGIAALIAAVVYCYNKFETFRGIVHGVWETFKSLVSFIKEGVMVYVKGLIEMFSGLGTVIKAVFSADWDGIKEGAKQTINAYKNTASGMLDVAKTNAPKIAGAWKEGYAKGVNSGGIDADGFFGSLGSSATGATGLAGAGGGGGSTPMDTMKSIAGGGSRPTNITVQINKEMVGSITINPVTMSQGVDEVKEMMMQALAQILNSTNRIALE